MLSVGTLVDGKYRILSKIGRGGMSTVYLAINEKANKPWAIKEVRKSLDADYELLKQSLIAETDLLKKLNHPNLPSIVDVIDSDENFLIVMDYIEGNTLEKIMEDEGAQPQEMVVKWALELCDVLEYLHSLPNPVIYRDMKPSNIMLKSDGSVMLIDFGTAREFKKKNAADTVCLGTQGYAAPEQFGGMGQTDARTDIYCLGATIYHLLTGHNPSQPPYEMYPITYWNSLLSTGLERIIQKCTQKNPKDRYQNVSELKYELEHYHDLEAHAQKGYKIKIGIFAASALITLLFGIGSLAFKVNAENERQSRYNELIELAEITGNSQDACQYYMEAIALDDTRKEAYHSFYAKAIEDGVFDDDEEDMFIKLTISTHKYIQNFRKSSEKEYADFCYEMGNAYWYYYVHEENRQSRALSWYQIAKDYYENDDERALEYRRCSIYVELGTFYKLITMNQIQGSDEGLYGDYWKSLVKLKEANDAEPDRDIITLRIYQEIVAKVIEYANNFKDDGIDEQEIRTILGEIEEAMADMKLKASTANAKEIDVLNDAMEMAYKILSVSYKEA